MGDVVCSFLLQTRSVMNSNTHFNCHSCDPSFSFDSCVDWPLLSHLLIALLLPCLLIALVVFLLSDCTLPFVLAD